jgi:hypothetical protein
MVEHFVNSAFTQTGYGCFLGVKSAVRYSRGLSKNAIRKFEKYKSVPKQFFLCLNEIGLIDDDSVPKHCVNINEVKTILGRAGFREGLTREEYFDLGLHKQDGTQKHIWHKIIDYMRHLKYVKKPR